MRRAAASIVLALAALAGCATTATDGALVPFDRLGQAVVVGRSDKAGVLAALGPTTSVRFDSGYEVWCYHYRPARPSATPGDGEYVILFDPQGVVRKTRQREPGPPEP
jgi:hypothetical protein